MRYFLILILSLFSCVVLNAQEEKEEPSSASNKNFLHSDYFKIFKIDDDDDDVVNGPWDLPPGPFLVEEDDDDDEEEVYEPWNYYFNNYLQDTTLDPTEEKVPEYNVTQALEYLQNLHDYLQSVGGINLYTYLKDKSDTDRTEIQNKIFELMQPIIQNIESSSSPIIGGGLGSISLEGFFGRLHSLMETLIILQDQRLIGLKVMKFFANLGCKKDNIAKEFPVQE